MTTITLPDWVVLVLIGLFIVQGVLNWMGVHAARRSYKADERLADLLEQDKP